MKKFFKTRKRKNEGLTLVEALVGITLMIIVFIGIYAAFQFAFKAVRYSQNKITAIALANQIIEQVRNLPYESVGVKGGFPEGVLEPATTTFRNNIEYQIETRVDYIVDPTDGISYPEDECPNDYKRIEVKVSWGGWFKGEVRLSTDIAPENLAQECAEVGGILSVSVFDAQGIMVSSPLIEIKDPSTDEVIKTATPLEGKHFFSLSPATYKVVVSKEGSSSAKTYDSGDTYNGKTIITPENPHPIVFEGQLTEVSFSIDKLSSFAVDTLSPWGSESFRDSFLDESKISERSEVKVENGEVVLASSTQGYFPSGYLLSIEISPSQILRWYTFSFTDSEPENTDLKYQIYFASGTEWYLIPDSDLPGNSTGFDTSPLDLSNLSTTTYSSLKLKANFSTNATSFTPSLYDWEISWITTEPTPISNVSFSLRGEKIVGTDENDEPIYKYEKTYTSDAFGHLDIGNLEWDCYTFSPESTSGFDLVNTDPSPQPIGLPPATSLPVKLYLKAENSLLITVQDEETLDPVVFATTTLKNESLSYQNSQYTDEKGQSYFIPLQSATYDLEIEAPGYLSTTTSIFVSGDVIETIRLKRIE